MVHSWPAVHACCNTYFGASSSSGCHPTSTAAYPELTKSRSYFVLRQRPSYSTPEIPTKKFDWSMNFLHVDMPDLSQASTIKRLQFHLGFFTRNLRFHGPGWYLARGGVTISGSFTNCQSCRYFMFFPAPNHRLSVSHHGHLIDP